jgi:hypothetical protein
MIVQPFDIVSYTERRKFPTAQRFHVAVSRQDTDIRRLTTGLRFENCVVRRFRRCANDIECTYTNLDSTV